MSDLSENVVQHIESYFGYCGNCQRPETVGRFTVRGWRHHFNLCSNCLKSLSNLIDTKPKQEELVPITAPHTLEEGEVKKK